MGEDAGFRMEAPEDGEGVETPEAQLLVWVVVLEVRGQTLTVVLDFLTFWFELNLENPELD